MKTTKLILLTAGLSVLVWTTACQNGPVTKTEVNKQPVANTAANSATPETAKDAKTSAETANTETKETSATKETSTGSMATPTEAYKTAYTARQKKDLPALKQVLSKKMLDFFTEMGATEKKTLDDQLKELVEQPQATTAESRNEKINGDKATLEYLNELGKWETMDFVKEDGQWKLTMPDMQSPVIENKPGK